MWLCPPRTEPPSTSLTRPRSRSVISRSISSTAIGGVSSVN
eukprot:CCRYP_004633-RA/>CCRYP_004633-RA protein AED:0.17 eAED:1.00 QI:0/-1/0/1/-1/0/1/0/40